MTCRIVAIDDVEEAAQEMLKIGADPAGIKLMAPKAVCRAVKVKGIKPAAANIIKQEMLSFGGEAAAAYGAINNSVAATDVLVFGTMKQLLLLVEKLKSHQFGLPDISREIDQAISNYERREKLKRTKVMGILNLTPDSFSDGGKYNNIEAAVAAGKQMLADGADIIDVGGESTRPGAAPVGVEEEKKRVVPVIERLAAETKTVISIDTTKAAVAKAAGIVPE